jgi:hypothetical protein
MHARKNNIISKSYRGNILSKITKIKHGKGILNDLITSELLPEMHIPGYNFCGPGTKLNKRIKYNKDGSVTPITKPINDLDMACLKHDVAYDKYHDLNSRHLADKLLEKSASEVMSNKSNKNTTRMNALAVKGIMKLKPKLNM